MPDQAIPPIPFNYTNRDYSSLRESLVLQLKNRLPEWDGHNDPNDFALALVESFAYAVDGLHYYLDRIANEAYAATAVRPESIRSMARLVGYRPARATPATVQLEFANRTTQEVMVPKGSLVQTSIASDITQSPVYFETTEEVAPIPPNAKATINAAEGITFSGEDGNGELLGISSGRPWQSYTLPTGPVLHGSVRVMIQYSEGWAQEWTQVEDIRAAAPGSSVFQLQTFSNDAARILFGSGSSGLIPPTGSAIRAIYRVGGGIVGNVKDHTITVISDDASLAGMTVTNHSVASGGTDEESIQSIRNNIIWRGNASPSRAVSLDDFDQVAMTHTGVGKARSFASEAADVLVVIGPTDDGTLTPGQRPDGSATDNMAALVSSVTTTLQSAAFAGAQIKVERAYYVQLDVKMTITVDDTAVLARMVEALNERLRSLFSYQRVDFGQTFSAFDLIAAFSLSGIKDVTVDTLCVHGGSGVHDVTLQPSELPWIDSNGALTVKASNTTTAGASRGITRSAYTAY